MFLFWGKKVNVNLQLKSNVVQPGGFIEGEVVVVAPKKNVKIENVRVTFYGTYSYRFSMKVRRRVETTTYSSTSLSTSKYRTVTETVSKRIDIAKMETMVSGARELIKGKEYRFPFRLQVPPNVPPTFSGRLAQISYNLKATVGIKWAPDKEDWKSIIVVYRNVDCSSPIEHSFVVDDNDIKVILPQCVFSGSDLVGQVILTPNENKTYEGIRLELIRREEIMFSRPMGIDVVSVDNKHVEVLAKEKFVGKTEFFAGVTKPFEFRVKIPMGEGTIKYQNLSVTYELKFTLEKKWAIDKSFSVPLTIIP